MAAAVATFLPSMLLGSRTKKRSNGISAIQTIKQLRHVSLAINERLLVDKKGNIYSRTDLMERGKQKPCYIAQAFRSKGVDLRPEPALPYDVIEEFYSAINNKNLERLRELISEDCFYEDETFLDPLKGKKETMHFLTELTRSTGEHVKFKVDRVYEGRELTVGVLWHLEWQGKHIPFTKGCSFYDCGKQGERLVIKKVYVVVESTLKPGMFALNLLKTTSFLFDQFPSIAESFLEKHHEIVKLVISIYKRLVEPLILPAFMYYTNMWKFIAPVITYFLKILLQILRINKRGK